MDNYKVIKALGQGTWGVVHMAEQKATGRVVAVKKIKSQESREGVNFTAIREIKLLREFKHPNIIELVDCFTTPDGAVCLVYECAFTDLEKILQNKSIPISLADTKQHLHALLSAISACHDRWILHREYYRDGTRVVVCHSQPCLFLKTIADAGDLKRKLDSRRTLFLYSLYLHIPYVSCCGPFHISR